MADKAKELFKKEFLTYSPEEKANFVNKFILQGISLADIAMEQFGMSRSWLSKLMIKEGYFNPGGNGYKLRENVNKSVVELQGELMELLEYKDKLIELAKAQTISVGSDKPDVVIIKPYEEEELIPRSFKLPKTLSDEFDSLGTQLRLKKQDLCTLAIAYFVEQYKDK